MGDEKKPPLQPWNPPAETVPPAWIMAAKKGCGMCHGRLRVPPAAAPFAQGPNIGRYFCLDCWTLVWKSTPQDLADDQTRRFVNEESNRILLKRQASVIFQEGDSRVYLSSRGTLVFDIRSKADLAPNEYDAAKIELLLRAINAIEEKKVEMIRVAVKA